MERPKTTWFQGHQIAKNDLNKELIHQHIVATQEYDHWRADMIEQFIIALNTKRDTNPVFNVYTTKKKEV